MARSNEKKLVVFERRSLRAIFGPKRCVKGMFEIRNHEESEDVYDEANVAGI